MRTILIIAGVPGLPSQVMKILSVVYSTNVFNKLLKKVWNITFALNFCTYSSIIFTWVLHVLKDCSFPYILQKSRMKIDQVRAE